MNYIEYKEGKVYDTSHLRPFNLELAKQGHPLAHIDGEEINLLRCLAGIWHYDRWMHPSRWWRTCFAHDVFSALRLAPLAVKEDSTGKLKPLHVGDVIEVFVPDFGVDKYVVKTIKSVAVWKRLKLDLTDDWRWPVEQPC